MTSQLLAEDNVDSGHQQLQLRAGQSADASGKQTLIDRNDLGDVSHRVLW